MVLEKQDGAMKFAHPKSCVKCYHCVAICPEDAVTCDEFPLEAFTPMSRARPATPAGTRNLLLQRRSIREFKNKEVSRKLLEELVHVGAHAPTGHNHQGVHLTIINDQEKIRKLDLRITRAFNALVSIFDNPVGQNVLKNLDRIPAAEALVDSMEAQKRFQKAGEPRSLAIFRGAPVLVLAHTGQDALTGHDDSIIALSHMMAVANAHGLGATWIGLIVGAVKLDPSLKRALGIPRKHTLDAAMILGWPKYKYRRHVPRKPIPVKWM